MTGLIADSSYQKWNNIANKPPPQQQLLIKHFILIFKRKVIWNIWWWWYAAGGSGVVWLWFVFRMMKLIAEKTLFSPSSFESHVTAHLHFYTSIKKVISLQQMYPHIIFIFFHYFTYFSKTCSVASKKQLFLQSLKHRVSDLIWLYACMHDSFPPSSPPTLLFHLVHLLLLPSSWITMTDKKVVCGTNTINNIIINWYQK